MGNIKLKNKRILVTGGKGYLGSFLVKKLEEEEAEVFTVSRTSNSNANHFSTDITDFKSLKNTIEKIKPQIIYHLAATLNRDRDFAKHDEIMNINYNGTLNLLKALQNIDYENFIFASSSEIYGKNETPFHEGQSPNPVSPYSLSKTNAEFMIKIFSELHQKNFTILRIFNFYGEQMPEAFFIPQMINTLLKNETFNMTKGEQFRDFLYIDDVIEAMVLAYTNENSRNQLLNVCSGESISLKALVTSFSKIINGQGSINFGALPYRENEIWNMVGSNIKLNKILNFTPKFSLEEGIKRVISNTKI